MSRLEREAAVVELLRDVAPTDVSPRFLGWVREWLARTDKRRPPMQKGVRMTLEREQEMREAVRKAERRIDDQWFFGRAHRSPEIPPGERWRVLDEAKVAARAAVREELRARWRGEDEGTIEYPSHICRMGTGTRRATRVALPHVRSKSCA
jgi:hypothetical protein